MKQRCNKATYPSKEEAREKLKEIQAEPPKENAKRNRRGKPLKPRRAYFCPRCEGWHLTSMSVAKAQAIKLSHIRSIAEQWVRKKGWDR